VEEKSLQLLCKHTRASVRTLYVLNKEDGRLELVSGYALKRNGQATKSLAMGEGIPGQCASEVKILEVEDIPSTSAFTIDTGLVELAPHYVIAVPILFQDAVLGVLVLGATRKFGDLEKEIVNNSVPQLSVAITNAMNTDREAERGAQREEYGDREGLSGEVRLPLKHVPRAAHAAQFDHRVQLGSPWPQR
jgi:signal transduction protein with GAF and PtsI domain